MAFYTGEFKDFETFIGPRLRNIVQTSIARKYKKKVGICEGTNCSSSQNLEAAHVHGRGRKQLIALAYSQNLEEGNRINLNDFENDFVALHYPLEENFKILCKSCHNEYDNIKEKVTLSDYTDPEWESESETLEIELYPADTTEFKELLLQYKSAYITTYYNDDSYDRKEWNASKFSESSNIIRNLRSRPEFRQGNWQKLSIKRVLVQINY